MDIVYVLIGFVCGFLCCSYIHFRVWLKRRKLEKTKYGANLTKMTLQEVEEMCEQVSREIINEKKREMRNGK